MPLERLLILAYPLLDNFDVYTLQNGELVNEIKMGDMLPFWRRPVKHRNFIIPLHLEPKEQFTFYIRVKTTSAVQLPIYLQTEQDFLEEEQASLVGQGMYFGITAAMILYNLFLYISIRDRNYLFYVVSVGCTSLVQASLRGYSYHFLWSDYPLIQHYHLPIIVSLSGAFVALFSVYFLNLRHYNFLLYRVIMAIVAFLILTAVFSPLIGYTLSVRIGLGVTMLCAIAGLTAGISVWKAGFKPAGYFTAAYFALFMGTLLIALSKFGVLPRNFFTENAQELGSILEVLLLSFALAYRISILRQEKEEARLEVTTKLEHKVEERTTELKDAMQRLVDVNSKLSRQNREDGLTGALNRRYFDEVLDLEWKRAIRSQSSIALIMCDVDHFKTVNDNYGHLGGNDCLRLVSTCIRSCVGRPSDLVFRYGGEEFALLLPDADQLGAKNVEEKIRRTLESQPFYVNENALTITMSLGVSSSIPEPEDDCNELISRADEALYTVKQNGRNRVVSAD